MNFCYLIKLKFRKKVYLKLILLNKILYKKKILFLNYSLLYLNLNNLYYKNENN